MSARDELAGIVAGLTCCSGLCAESQAAKTADAILAAGYSKPRTITTAEERAAIRPGAVCVDLDGNAWKRGTGSWVSTGGDTPPLYDEVDYTLTVLYEP